VFGVVRQVRVWVRVPVCPEGTFLLCSAAVGEAVGWAYVSNLWSRRVYRLWPVVSVVIEEEQARERWASERVAALSHWRGWVSLLWVGGQGVAEQILWVRPRWGRDVVGNPLEYFAAWLVLEVQLEWESMDLVRE